MAEAILEMESHAYQIGTVSSLTGLDPQTIRGWERRYGAIRPARTDTGRRRYDDESVERLQLLKALVDCGQAIGTIAHLGDDDLRARLQKIVEHESKTAGHLDPRAEKRVYQTAILGSVLPTQIEANAGQLAEFRVQTVDDDRERFSNALRAEGCDVVLIELDELGSGGLGFVQACRGLPGRPLIGILYRFASRVQLAKLAGTGAILIKSPIRLAQLRRILLDQIMIANAMRPEDSIRSIAPPPDEPISDTAGAPPNRRFDDAQLARLLEVSTSIDCECPNHVSSIVTALVAFEDYSNQCESRDEADRELHARLAGETAVVRSQMESLLADLCAHEKISV